MGLNTLIIVLVLLIVLLFAMVLILALTMSARFRSSDARLSQNLKSYGDIIASNQKVMNDQQDMRLKALEESLERMRQENSRQIDNIRKTVDDKLQTTLDEKLTRSFGMVNERLEEVYKGLGEMKSVASSVGDLKKILSNVKTRGILGEVQLSAILEQIMPGSQYDENVATVPGSTCRVEFAIRLPGDGNGCVYLPIDSKFPGDTYASLMDAYDSGSRGEIEECKKRLFAVMEQEAADIQKKYIAPPHTTDFAIMFLPFEGLYAEAVNGGMIEKLQRRYKVTIAGPTTMAALLNSLQMGFNTLAIEKRSAEVWSLLGAVKTEFGNFGSVLDDTQKKMNQASASLDKLIGTRTRQIQRRLKDVTALDEEESRRLLDS